MANTFDAPVILSLCPGVLGLERGLTRAIGKLSVAAYVEIETFICANLIAGMEEGLLDPAPVWTDVKTFPATEFHGKINGIIGGYPCQPFSVAGNQAGVNDPRHLFPFILQHVKDIQPEWCFFENVRGHFKLGYPEVYRSLRDAGYAVECGIYSAEEVGATHRRERLFILAIKLADAQNSIRRLREPAERNKNRYVTGTGEKLDNTNIGRRQQCRTEVGKPLVSNEGRNAKLADAENTGLQSNRTGSVRTQQEKSMPTGNSAELANTDSERRQLPVNRGQSTKQELSGDDTPGSVDRWPARPGEQQHDWEEPRAVEPGLGCTINGYNFKEDLLRAYGNSVVEQTAEKAFLDLLSVHEFNYLLS